MILFKGQPSLQRLHSTCVSSLDADDNGLPRYQSYTWHYLGAIVTIGILATVCDPAQCGGGGDGGIWGWGVLNEEKFPSCLFHQANGIFFYPFCIFTIMWNDRMTKERKTHFRRAVWCHIYSGSWQLDYGPCNWHDDCMCKCTVRWLQVMSNRFRVHKTEPHLHLHHFQCHLKMNMTPICAPQGIVWKKLTHNEINSCCI